jgi:hypothetical protein
MQAMEMYLSPDNIFADSNGVMDFKELRLKRSNLFPFVKPTDNAKTQRGFLKPRRVNFVELILIKYTEKNRLISKRGRTAECLMTRWLAVGLPCLRWSVCKPEKYSVSVAERHNMCKLEVVQQNHPLSFPTSIHCAVTVGTVRSNTRLAKFVNLSALESRLSNAVQTNGIKRQNEFAGNSKEFIILFCVIKRPLKFYSLQFT